MGRPRSLRPVDLTSTSEATAFDDWITLAELLREHEPDLLTRFDFPTAQSAQLEDYVASALRLAASGEKLASWRMVVRTLRRLVPQLVPDAYEASAGLELRMLERPLGERPVPLRPLSPELEYVLAQPLVSQSRDELVVARVLRDL